MNSVPDPSRQTGSSTPPASAGEAGRVRRFRISGMDCAGCAGSVGRAIERVPGVASAQVDFAAAEALVRGPAIDPAAIERAVRAAGFGAEVLAVARTPVEHRSEIEQAQLARERGWARRAAAGLLIWLPMVALHWAAPHEWAVWKPWALAALATLAVAVVGTGFYQ